MSTKVAELVVDVSGRQSTLPSMLSSIKSELQKVFQEAQKSEQVFGSKLPRSQQQAGSSALQHAQALSRLQAASGNTAQAVNTLANAINKEDQAATATIRAKTQLVGLQGKLRKELDDTARGFLGSSQAAQQFTGVLQGINGALGTIGLAVGAQQLIQFAVGAGKSSMELQRVQNVTKAIAGDQETYNKIIATAKEQQSLYGGSLQQNIEDLAGFAVQARMTGANLDTLISTAQRLAFFDPGQGLQGASIALREAMAGNPASLAARFEMPRSALVKLRDESATTAERLQVINDVLASAGISGDIAKEAITDTARAYNDFGASLDTIKNKVGGGLAELFAPVANKMAKELTFKDDLSGGRTTALQDAKSYDEYTAAVQRNTSAIEEAAGVKQNGAERAKTLSTAEFTYAKALIATGTASDQANARALALRTTYTQLNNARNQAVAFGGEEGGTNKVYDGLIEQITRVAAVSPLAEANVQALTQKFSNGQISVSEYQAALNSLEASQIRAANAAAFAEQREGERIGGIQQSAAALYAKAAAEIAAAQAGQLYTDSEGQAIIATQESANAALLAGQAKEQYNQQMALLQGQTQLAASSFLALNPNIDASGIASAVAAGKISTAVGQYIAMTLETNRARAELAMLQAQAGTGVVSQNTSKRGGGAGRQREVMAAFEEPLDDPGSVARANSAIARSKAQAQAERDRAAALREATMATGSASDKQAVLNKDLADARRLYGENSAEAIRAQTALTQFQQSQSKGGGGGGGRAAAAKLSDQQKLNNQLYDQEVKLDSKLQDEEKKHVKKLLDIEKNYLEKSLEQQKKNEVAKRKSRYDFYDSLSQATGDIGTGTADSLAAQYEEAYRRSQEMAAAGNQQQAAEYLALRQSQLQADLDYYQQRAEAEKQSKSDDKKEALAGAQEVQRLDALEAMRKDAQREELAQVEQGGDAIVAERQRQLDEESVAYAEATGKVIENSDRATERKIENAIRAGKAVNAENIELERQSEILDRLGKTNATPTTSSNTIAPTEPPPTPSATPDAAAATPTTSQVISAVLDQALVDAVNIASAANLAKLDAVIASLGTLNDTAADIGRRVSAVESAVRSQKNNGGGMGIV